MVLSTSTFVAGASLLLLSTTASAQSKTSSAVNATVSIYLGASSDQQPLDASIVSANPTVTAYAINCKPGTDSTECGYPLGFNITVTSNSIYDFTYNPDPGLSFSQRCTVQGSAVCAETAAGSQANFPGSSIETYPVESVTLSPVTITAGLEKLATATTASNASRSGSSSQAPSATGTANAAVGHGVELAMGLLAFASLIFAQF